MISCPFSENYNKEYTYLIIDLFQRNIRSKEINDFISLKKSYGPTFLLSHDKLDEELTFMY